MERLADLVTRFTGRPSSSPSPSPHRHPCVVHHSPTSDRDSQRYTISPRSHSKPSRAPLHTLPSMAMKKFSGENGAQNMSADSGLDRPGRGVPAPTLRATLRQGVPKLRARGIHQLILTAVGARRVSHSPLHMLLTTHPLHPPSRAPLPGMSCECPSSLSQYRCVILCSALELGGGVPGIFRTSPRGQRSGFREPDLTKG